MKTLSIAPINLTDENIGFIEIWMQVNSRSSRDTMFLDLGAISEDIIPNRRLNSEDLVLSRTPNGTLQEGEDIGLDMTNDDLERVLYGSIPGIDPSDPSGDDYAFNNSSATEDFTRINGTENNKNSPGGLTPDTEDLNNNADVDGANAYFQYEIPLDTVASHNPLIVGGGSNGWYQFRIPIRDYSRKIGLPLLDNVEFIRAGFRNVADTIALRIADFSLVGNQWQDIRKGDTTFARVGDSTFAVSVVSIEDNPGYQSPPGVVRERDRTRPDEDVQANEQSLALLLRGLQSGQSRQAVKNFSLRPLDLFSYRTMKMFVHGDEHFVYNSVTDYDAEIFFRFGSDTLNFYEYRAPIHPGWDPPLNEIIINFSDLTAIKQSRDSVSII